MPRMLILAVANHLHHDSSAVVAQDYQILSAVQTERLTRVKGDGQSAHQPTIAEALRIAGASIRDVDALLISPYSIPVQYFAPWPLKRLSNNYFARRVRGRTRYATALPSGARYREVEYTAKLIPERCLKDLGLRENCEFFLFEHHFSHALSALFFTDYENALIYTADGGGDFRFYSAHYLSGATLIPTPPPRGEIALAAHGSGRLRWPRLLLYDGGTGLHAKSPRGQADRTRRLRGAGDL